MIVMLMHIGNFTFRGILSANDDKMIYISLRSIQNAPRHELIVNYRKAYVIAACFTSASLHPSPSDHPFCPSQCYVSDRSNNSD